MPSYYAGNVRTAGQEHRGWLVGHFIGVAGDALHSPDIEVKWGEHRAGDERTEWTSSASTSLAILVRGRFRFLFSAGKQEHVLLHQEGDFVIWQPGTPHTWKAEDDSLVITIRWPSTKTT